MVNDHLGGDTTSKGTGLLSGGPRFKFSSLPLHRIVFGDLQFNASTFCKSTGLPPTRTDFKKSVLFVYLRATT